MAFGDEYPAEPQNAVCLSCHRGGERLHWNGSIHEARGVACASCHNIHNPRAAMLQKDVRPDALVRKDASAACYGCHPDVRAQTHRISSHPIKEGEVTCNDCHNVHGSPSEHLLVKRNVNETCYQCHAEKRGPFLWEHQPARDDCLTCHASHGSTQRALLKQRTPWLCQECHSAQFHPSTEYTAAGLPGGTREPQPAAAQLHQLPLRSARLESSFGRAFHEVATGMEHERVRRFASGALVALAGLVAVLPAAALPPEENQSWIELGAWVNSDDSYKFGDFTGLEEKGISLLANFDISRRAVWDSGDVRWWRAQGQNLGLDSRWARGDFGYQGLFDVWFEYEEIPKFQTDSAITVFQGRGTDRLTLRPSWVASSTTAGFSALAENERDLDIEHMRRDVRAGFGLDLPADLEWVGDYEYETKKGRKVVAALIGNTGGNPRYVARPRAARLPDERGPDGAALERRTRAAAARLRDLGLQRLE